MRVRGDPRVVDNSRVVNDVVRKRKTDLTGTFDEHVKLRTHPERARQIPRVTHRIDPKLFEGIQNLVNVNVLQPKCHAIAVFAGVRFGVVVRVAVAVPSATGSMPVRTLQFEAIAIGINNITTTSAEGRRPLRNKRASCSRGGEKCKDHGTNAEHVEKRKRERERLNDKKWKKKVR